MNSATLLQRIALATEAGGGLLLALERFTPAVGVLLVAITATLVFVSWPHEFPLYLLFGAVAIALAGGTAPLGVAIGVGAAVTLEALRQLGRLRAAQGPAAAMSELENP
jgi:hypothetical protein